MPQAHDMRIGIRRSTLPDGSLIGFLPPARDRLNALTISTDSRIAAGFDDGRVEHWKLSTTRQGRLSLPTRSLSFSAHQGKVTDVAFVGTKLITCGADGIVKSWDLSVRENPTINVGMCGLEFALAPGSEVAALVDVEQLSVVDFETGQRYDRPLERGTHQLAYSTDGACLYVTHDKEKVLEICEPNSGQPIRRVPLDGAPIALDASPADQCVAIIDGEGWLDVIDASAGTRRIRISVDGELDGSRYHVAYSPDGQSILASGEFGKIVVIDPETGDIVESRTVDHAVDCLRFSTSGKMFATGHTNGSINVWKWPSLELVSTMVGHDNAVVSVVFSPDERVVISSAFDLTTRVWSVRHARTFGILTRSDVPSMQLDFDSRHG